MPAHRTWTGERLELARDMARKGATQKEAAEALGVSIPRMSVVSRRYGLGFTDARVEHLRQIAKDPKVVARRTRHMAGNTYAARPV